MRFLELLETINVFEAARDRYMQMFVGIIEISQNIVTTPTAVKDNVDWAIRVLKKSDRIVWYLRLYKLYLLKQSWAGALQSAQKMLHHESDTMQRAQAHENALALEAAYKKELAKHAKKSESTADRIEAIAMRVSTTDDFRTSAEHFFSLDIAAIRDYVFGWKTWAVIIADLERIEDAWKKKQERFIPIQREGVETIIRFPDKSEWINLNKSSCDIEAKAMGHCGNTAGYQESDTVLTYRTIEKDPKAKQKVWVPHLTFILNTASGMLGEMKGFNNQHPDQKYHNVIIELLKLPLIKGIVGGGYKPENNFKLSDLPEETFKQMMESKPGLGTLTDHYVLTGVVDNELFNKIGHVLEDAGFPIENFDHNSEENIFLIDSNIGPGIDDLYNQYGQGGIDENPDVDSSEIKMVFDDMDDQFMDRFLFYVKNEYHVEPKNSEDLYRLLMDESDVIIEKIEELLKETHKEGIKNEAEMWLDHDFENTAYFRFENGTYQLIADEGVFMEILLPKAQNVRGYHGTSRSWITVIGHLLPDPTNSYYEGMHGGDNEWVSEHVERLLMKDEEVRKLLAPTPEEMGQLRLFKGEEEKRRLSAST